MTTFKKLEVNDVPYINEDNMSFLCKPSVISITDDWLIVQVYSDNPEKCFYLFNFVTKRWCLLQHNLPVFGHQTCIIFNGRYFMVHGTEDREEMIYRTYIGDITEGLPISFHFAAILQTPDIKYGEHRLVVAKDNVYVISGYDIIRSKEATVHCFHPQFKIWEVIYQVDPQLNSIQQPINYQPPRENCILYYDEKLYVFSNHRDRCANDLSACYRMLPQHVAVFDRRSARWTSKTMRLRRWDMPRRSPSPQSRSAEDGRRPVMDECSVAQCPRQPWLVYATVSNESSAAGPAWDTWLLDLNTENWQRLVVVVRVPLMERPVALTTAITPGGEMYAIRATGRPDARRHVFRARVRFSTTDPPPPPPATTTSRRGPHVSSYHADQRFRFSI